MGKTNLNASFSVKMLVCLEATIVFGMSFGCFSFARGLSRSIAGLPANEKNLHLYALRAPVVRTYI